MPGPDPGSFGAVDAGAVPTVVSFEGADAAFAAGAPLDCSSERWPLFFGAPGLGGSAFTRYRDRTYTEVVQVIFDAFLAVAAVGGDGAGRASGACGDSVRPRALAAARHADCRAPRCDPGRCHRRCRRSGACARTRPAPAFCRGEERHGGSVTTRGCAVTASRTSWLPLAVHNPRFEGNPNLLLPSAVRWRCPEDAQPQAGSRMPGTEPQGCGARSSQRGRERGLTNCRSHVLSPLRPHQFS
ncbi:Uncharacterised protein [Mycobacterium tuberculosis]|nr:Uncharacterised protein [Mycobacterium tuberculosis]